MINKNLSAFKIRTDRLLFHDKGPNALCHKVFTHQAPELFKLCTNYMKPLVYKKVLLLKCKFSNDSCEKRIKLKKNEKNRTKVALLLLLCRNSH